ncbi:hypothetical protein [Alkalibacillus haloalkaliphilus]|uniref:Lycopene cyclase domain-containing protein n=1 Tax=Alkalibacillus haloalkaliphilus TaxID=94136 RepID=A0A511W5U0_9BACI|nr:hypothetical protein [Alkalibacillus haloalkaliphilus]GEN45413.1 hypothetical protein AHA02nite_11890 [Alkalibacillus haloalkaliphilus]
MLLEFVNVLILVATVVLLIVGLIISRKLSFTGGFYFFLLLLISELYQITFATSITIMRYFQEHGPPMGMTMGEYVMWTSYIPRVLELIAFTFLVVGLFKLWKSSTSNTKEMSH